MKKIFTGVFCSTLLLATTVVASSTTIQATLFPSSVTFNNGGIVKSIESENEILNYNNKAYILLRSFSEAIGATVDYQYASESSNGLHQINVEIPSNP